MFWAGFRRQSRYRAALAVGMAANLFFGVIRTALFLALYRQQEVAGGLTKAEAITYVWIIQAVFGVVFVSWLWDFADRVRSGDFVVDLVRPGDVLGRLLALDAGRSSFALLTRGLPQLVLGGVVLDLVLPTTVPSLALLALSFVLCIAAACELRLLCGSLAFWTADYRGWWTFLFSGLWVLGGFFLPVQFYPDAIRWIGEHGPLAAMLVSPVRVATGQGVPAALAVQVVWVGVGFALCRRVMARAERRLVVHGG